MFWYNANLDTKRVQAFEPHSERQTIQSFEIMKNSSNIFLLRRDIGTFWHGIDNSSSLSHGNIPKKEA